MKFDMNDSTSKITDGTFRALVGEQTFDIVFDEGRLRIDGEAVDYAFEPISEGYFSLLIDGRSLPVVVEETPGGRLRVTIAGREVDVTVQDEKALLLERFGLNEATSPTERALHAPMPGLVLSIMVEPGQAVHRGEGLLVLEAMKMENELRAPTDGVVKALHVTPGDTVDKNALLLEFEA